MSAPEAVLELVDRFHRNLDAYKRGQYNETQVRRSSSIPSSRPWAGTCDNEQGYAEQYKDVVHEDAIKVGGTTKAPDYCLPHRRRAQVLRGGQKALGRHQGRHPPGLPTAPLRLERQAAAEHPHRL